MSSTVPRQRTNCHLIGPFSDQTIWERAKYYLYLYFVIRVSDILYAGAGTDHVREGLGEA